MVHVDHLKKLIGDGISENQYIFDLDESMNIEPDNELDRNSDEEGVHYCILLNSLGEEGLSSLFPDIFNKI